MKVFVTLRTPRGDVSLQTLAAQLEAILTAAGCIPFIATAELQKRGLSPGFMQFIRQHIEQSDVLLLIYHPDLQGGLIEQGIAYALNIPIWLAHPTGLKVSTTALECSTKIIAYQTYQDLILALQLELKTLKENI